MDFVNKYRTDIMQVLSCENYKIPAIMSWPFFFALISLEVCLHQCWICSSGFYPSVLIQPCRLHNQVTIFAMLAAFCSVLKIGSTWLSGMLKSGKDSIFKLWKEKKIFHTLLKTKTNCHQSRYKKAGLKISIRSGRETVIQDLTSH